MRRRTDQRLQWVFRQVRKAGAAACHAARKLQSQLPRGGRWHENAESASTIATPLIFFADACLPPPMLILPDAATRRFRVTRFHYLAFAAIVDVAFPCQPSSHCSPTVCHASLPPRTTLYAAAFYAAMTLLHVSRSRHYHITARGHHQLSIRHHAIRATE